MVIWPVAFVGTFGAIKYCLKIEGNWRQIVPYFATALQRHRSPPGTAKLASAVSNTASANPTRWFQFSLRTLLIATTLAGCAAGWMAGKLQTARHQQQAAEAIVKLGGEVIYAYQLDANGEEIIPCTPPGPQWLRNIDACGLLDEVAEIRIETDEQLSQIKNLPRLRTVRIACSERISDAGLKHLPEAPQLQQLEFGRHRHVTSAGLANLKSLPELQTLDVTYLTVGDADLKNIQGLKRLRELRFIAAQASAAALSEFRHALPGCKIEGP